jgi:hypothetical protein
MMLRDSWPPLFGNPAAGNIAGSVGKVRDVEP